MSSYKNYEIELSCLQMLSNLVDEIAQEYIK